MSKKNIYTLLFIAVLFCFSVFALKTLRVEAQLQTVYIRANGDVEPSWVPIQRNGDVYTFTGDVIVDGDATGMIIERDNIMLDGAGCIFSRMPSLVPANGIELKERSNVTIKNLEIKQFAYGVLLSDSSGNAISESNLTNNGYGVYLDYSSDNTEISGNTIANNANGIFLNHSSYNIIIGNKLANNGTGIYLEYFSNSNIIRGNTFVNNGLCVYASYGNVVDDNLVNCKPLVYFEGVSDVVIEEAGQVVLIQCNRVQVRNLNLSNADVGLILWQTNNTEILGNTMANNNDGIWLGASSENIISGNIFVNNYLAGIRVGQYSSSNTIKGNTVANNEYGVYIFLASNNNIYHNNFLDNIQHVSLGFPRYPNYWNAGYPLGGNYWDDYQETDLLNGPSQSEIGSDGIGDAEYVISEYTMDKDNYPLMGTCSNFSIESGYDLQTICNSTISDFLFNGTAINFNVLGKNETSGFCRICIPSALMSSPFEVFINGTKVAHNLLPCSNGTHSYLYFNYNHSTREVIIITEFPSLIILPLLMAATLLATLAYTRRQTLKH